MNHKSNRGEVSTAVFDTRSGDNAYMTQAVSGKKFKKIKNTHPQK
jgi:hypothetical protein